LPTHSKLPALLSLIVVVHVVVIVIGVVAAVVVTRVVAERLLYCQLLDTRR